MPVAEPELALIPKVSMVIGEDLKASGSGRATKLRPAPFGGHKQSGYGRPGGAAGVREFSQLKNVYMNLR